MGPEFRYIHGELSQTDRSNLRHQQGGIAAVTHGVQIHRKPQSAIPLHSKGHIQATATALQSMQLTDLDPATAKVPLIVPTVITGDLKPHGSAGRNLQSLFIHIIRHFLQIAFRRFGIPYRNAGKTIAHQRKAVRTPFFRIIEVIIQWLPHSFLHHIEDIVVVRNHQTVGSVIAIAAAVGEYDPVGRLTHFKGPQVHIFLGHQRTGPFSANDIAIIAPAVGIALGPVRRGIAIHSGFDIALIFQHGGGIEFHRGIKKLTGIIVIFGIVLNAALHSDHITLLQQFRTVALHAVAGDGFGFPALNDQEHRNVAIIFIIGCHNLRDGTAEGHQVRQLFTGRKLVGFVHHLPGVIRWQRTGLVTGNHSIQRTALYKLNGAEVIGQPAGDRNGITDFQRLRAVTFESIALNRHQLVAGNLNCNGNVTVQRIIGCSNFNDFSRECRCIGQGITFLQRIGFLQDASCILLHRQCPGRQQRKQKQDTQGNAEKLFHRLFHFEPPHITNAVL